MLQPLHMYSLSFFGSRILVKECKSAIKNKLSLLACLDSSIAGTIAPKILPKCGVPVLCIP